MRSFVGLGVEGGGGRSYPAATGKLSLVLGGRQSVTDQFSGIIGSNTVTGPSGVSMWSG